MHWCNAEEGGLFLTQAFMEKSIVRASKRNGFAAVFVCGGGGAADLELEPTQEYTIWTQQSDTVHETGKPYG
jgi:hypothetical protein